MEEVWKDIKGYEGVYQVSNLGNVKSKSRILKQKIANIGYKVVTLFGSEGVKYRTVHRLVANEFIENINNKPTVNHIDGNKVNNELSNLEFATYSENNHHAYDIGLKRKLFGADNFHSKAVAQIDFNGLVVNKFTSIVEACKATGANKGHISSCCSGKRKTAGGYKWVKESDL